MNTALRNCGPYGLTSTLILGGYFEYQTPLKVANVNSKRDGLRPPSVGTRRVYLFFPTNKVALAMHLAPQSAKCCRSAKASCVLRVQFFLLCFACVICCCAFLCALDVSKHLVLNLVGEHADHSDYVSGILCADAGIISTWCSLLVHDEHSCRVP